MHCYQLICFLFSFFFSFMFFFSFSLLLVAFLLFKQITQPIEQSTNRMGKRKPKKNNYFQQYILTWWAPHTQTFLEHAKKHICRARYCCCHFILHLCIVVLVTEYFCVFASFFLNFYSHSLLLRFVFDFCDKRERRWKRTEKKQLSSHSKYIKFI